MLKKKGRNWTVYENATQTSIRLFNKRQLAVLNCTFQNSGGAFAGWTPPFMIDRKITVDKKTK